MEKWQKIEQLINLLLVRLLGFLKTGVTRVTPKKVSDRVARTHTSYTQKKTKLQNKIVTTTKNSGSWAKSINRQLRILFFTAQEKTALLVGKMKAIRLRDALLLIGAFLTPLLFKFKSWWIGLKPETVVLFFTGGMMGGLTMIGLVTSGSKIAADKEEVQARIPASKVESATAISSRPHYYKLPERSYTVLNVQLPIYAGGANSMQSIQVDFTIISSNRYIRQFFLGHETLVHDRLNTHLEPIEAEFIFEEEGKNVLKHKIRHELNLLLEENGVEGRVDEVHVHTMLAI